MKRIIIFLCVLLVNSCFGVENYSLRDLFKNNKAVIYTINIRNFGAIDKDFDGIIDPCKGDIKGTFLNAKLKLKDLKEDGINVVYLLPITPTGKLKALGTAGSLYAMDSFNTINPEFDDLSSDLNVYDELKEFILEAHKLNLKVIVDLPSCGSYDLSIKKPDLFLVDEDNKTVTPSDWTDVRLFKTYSKDKTLDSDVLNGFKSFVDMTLNLGFDGIRADVAGIKPYEFWKNIIDYARSKNPDFYFLAEASPDWSSPVNNKDFHYSSINELLNAGFDSYYGSWSDFKNITSKKEFDLKITKNYKILKQYKDKSIISALATHDQPAPVLKGENYWDMVLWLSVLLPQNSYFLDGFNVGDDFIYDYENKKAQKTYTDDEYYFVHSGLFDIFNPASEVRKKHPEFKEEYLKAIEFKKRNIDLINKGKLKLINTNDDNIFAYSITSKEQELIVVGSLNEKGNKNIKLKSEYLKKDNVFRIINAKNRPDIEKNIINIKLEPLELQVYLIGLTKYKAM